MGRRKPPASDRRRSGSPPPARAESSTNPESDLNPPPTPSIAPLPRRLVIALVALLLLLSWSLATISLLRENPTVDEVVHLPAGISYWQTGSFRIYPHNPPLVKLLAALPVLSARPNTAPLYSPPQPPAPGKTPFGYGWLTSNKASFAHEFMELNAARYFELFSLARLIMPTFGIVGGLLVFFWSRSLYGDLGGLISLALWCLCPNLLAHSRLITTDVAATSTGFGAMFAFWWYLQRPAWGQAALAGCLLGLAQLTKFSALLLYGLWPFLWLLHEFLRHPSSGRLTRVRTALAHGSLILSLSVVVIDAGYGFQGLGQPLGSFRFTSRTLTVDRDRPIAAPRLGRPQPDLREGLIQYRANRFQGTLLGLLPSPLPEAYLTGFDDQKLEAEGVPPKALLFADDPRSRLPEANQTRGYPVFLDGQLAARSWWYYYLFALLYKVPEGTWALVLGSLGVLILAPRSRASAADETTLLLPPLVMLAVMSFGTNIALGLRYVLPIFPYVFVSAGKLGPWAAGYSLRKAFVGLGLLATGAATASIHPHYLAYFNLASGGPSRGSEHLIDSNLDWGQDLINLKAWVKDHAPDEPIGLAYFGQINPRILDHPPGSGLNWFLPPALPGTMPSRPDLQSNPPQPGLYAISASLLRGLPWRVYSPDRWPPYNAERDAYTYFARFQPVDHIGHSILIYRLSESDCEQLARLWPSR